MKQMKTKKINKRTILNRTIIITVIIIILVTISLKYISKKVNPIIFDYAEMEAKELSSIIVNKSISIYSTKDLNTNNLFIINKNSAGEIETVDFNSVKVNKFLSLITTSVQTNLRSIQSGYISSVDLPDSVVVKYNNPEGIIFRVPIGIVFDNYLLSNFGPKIPIKLNLVGEVSSKISTKVTNYGINNALIEAYLNITVSEKLIIPFSSKKIVFKSKIPIVVKMVKGTVPKYYSNGVNSNSDQLVVPVE